MAALTFLYSFVFCYIRSQLSQFTRETSSADHESSSHDLEGILASTPGLPSQSPPPAVASTFRKSTPSLSTTRFSPTDVRRPSVVSSNRAQTAASPFIARRRMLQVARSLLWYPLLYLCITAPITIGRLSSLVNNSWSQPCIFVGAAVYASGGFCNVLLYTTTRKGIVNWRWGGRDDREKELPQCEFSPGVHKSEGFTGKEKFVSKVSSRGNSETSSRGPAIGATAVYELGIEVNETEDEEELHGIAEEKLDQEEYEERVCHYPGCEAMSRNGWCTCRRNTVA